MVDDYKALASELEKNAEILLFALLKMDELTDRWTLILAGNGFDSVDKRREIFNQVFQLVARVLSKEARDEIARVGIFPMDDEIVQDLKRQEVGNIFKDQKANGSFVHYGCVLFSRNEENATLSLDN